MRGFSSMLDEYGVGSEEKASILREERRRVASLLSSSGRDALQSPEMIHERLKQMYGGAERVSSLLLAGATALLAAVLYLILGVMWGLWHPGWVVFVLPVMGKVVAGMVNEGERHVLSALTPYWASAVLLFGGFAYGLWHPLWSLYILMPLFALSHSRHRLSRRVFFAFLSLCVAPLVFVWTGYFTTYHPTWLLLVLIPLAFSFYERDLRIRMSLVLLLIAAALLYLLLSQADPLRALFVFLPFVLLAVWRVNQRTAWRLFKSRAEAGTALVVVGVFVLSSMVMAVRVSWLILLTIPALGAIRKRRETKVFTVLSALAAIAVFTLIGVFLDGFHYAWLGFLIVPLVSILEGRG